MLYRVQLRRGYFSFGKTRKRPQSGEKSFPIHGWGQQRKEELEAKKGDKGLVKKSKEAGGKHADGKVHIKVKIDGLEPMVINMVVHYPEVSETESSVQIVKRPNIADKVNLTKPNAEMAYHLKPLFIQGHLNKIPVPRMMVGNRAMVNILSANMMKRLGKTMKDLVPTDIVVRSFTGKATATWGILLMDVTILSQVKDDVVEVDLGDGHKSRPTYICVHLSVEQKECMTQLLKNFIDCFALDYNEMPGLNRMLVEHKIPLKPCFKPYKQPPRQFFDDITFKVKEEIKFLLTADFIEVAKFVEWFSNVVPVIKKNEMTHVYTNFRNFGITEG
ncbi:hypothetical protein ACH5RR_037353 [Cinchona calisaya]|uniref:Uncharacterized protein n=1 Tax=Cinchona calisaya TaxID=153742 RepID=A0ABD2Y5X5_9GENT